MEGGLLVWLAGRYEYLVVIDLLVYDFGREERSGGGWVGMSREV